MPTYLWKYDLYLIFPSAGLATMRNVAIDVMPDVNEGAMFDSYRLSVTGEEPASAFGARCPLTPALARKWKAYILPEQVSPEDFPDDEWTPNATWVNQIQTARENNRFIALVTRRINGQTWEPNNQVVIIKDIVKHLDVTVVPNIGAVLNYVGLQRIVAEEPA
jgi:hypothetical protein